MRWNTHSRNCVYNPLRYIVIVAFCIITNVAIFPLGFSWGEDKNYIFVLIKMSEMFRVIGYLKCRSDIYVS